MKIDVFYEAGIVCEFSYEPFFEMLCSLHILSEPRHHMHREIWVKKAEGLLVEELRTELEYFKALTDQFLIIMDFCEAFRECSDLTIIEALEYLENIPLYKINAIFKEYKSNISKLDYSRMLKLLKYYYYEIFQQELKYIQPIMIREIKRKAKVAKDKGVFQFLPSIHSRIEVTDTEIIFYKYKEFRFIKDKLKKIRVNISTFISPHLLLGHTKDTISLTYLLELNNNEEDFPVDLEKKLKALADGNRLRILREISKEGSSTQELSKIINISEAAVSKSLKLLLEANLVNKSRRGNYIIYSINSIQIDYLPYKIYEYINKI